MARRAVMDIDAARFYGGSEDTPDPGAIAEFVHSGIRAIAGCPEVVHTVNRLPSQVPPSADDDRTMAELLHRVANRDEAALVSMWAALSGEIAALLRPTLPDSADVAAVLTATFTEMWWLSPMHDTADTDVRGWLTSIARQRGIERQRGHAATPSSIPLPGAGNSWAIAINDETMELSVATMIIDSFTASRVPSET